MTEITYTEISCKNLERALSSLFNRVADNREILVIRHRGKRTVAMIQADELASLMETAHLSRSPKNARRLGTALNRAIARKGRPQTLSHFRTQLIGD